MQLVGQIAAWRINMSEASRCREPERPISIGTYDKSAFDYQSEHVARNDGQAVAFELLLDLYVAIGGNPFPEQKMRAPEVA